MFSCKHVIPLLLLVAAAEGLKAQDADEPRFTANPYVTTPSRMAEEADQAPASTYVITRAEIIARGYFTLEELLTDLPGMELLPWYQSEIGTRVPVRGIQGNNRILFMVNGMRINPPGGEEMPLRHDIDIQMAERVEVVYGPAATLYGQDACSAAINIITTTTSHRTLDNRYGEMLGNVIDLVDSGSRAAARPQLRLGYGSFGRVTVQAGLSQKLGDLDMTASAYYHQSDLSDQAEEYPEYWRRWYDPALAGTPQRGEEALNLFLRLEDENNSLQLWHRDSRRSSAEGGLGGIIYYVPEAVWADGSTVIEARNRFWLSNRLSVESLLSYNRYEIDPESRYVWPAAGKLYYDDWKYGIGRGSTLEERLNFRLSERVRCSGGFVAADYGIIPKTTVPGGADPGADIGIQSGWFTYYTRQGDAASEQRLPKAHEISYQSYGAYAEVSVDWLPALRTVAGVRLDHNSRLDSEWPFSPRFAALYQAGDFSLRYQFARAFVSPSPLNSYFTAENGQSFFIPNPQLESELATANELSLGYSRQQLSLNLALYHNRLDNLIVIDEQAPAAGTVWMDAQGTQPRLLKPGVNEGRSTARGLDLSGRYSLAKGSIWGSWSYVEVKGETRGITTPASGLSPHQLRLGITALPMQRLTATLSLVLRSTPEGSDGAAGVRTSMPYEVNGSLQFRAGRWLTLFGQVKNITNNHYGLAGVRSLLLQEPFSITGGLRLQPR